MMKFLRTLLALLGCVVIVVLAVDNRQLVEISFWPLPFTYPMPLYGILLFGLFLGAVLGGSAVWLSSRGMRSEARQLKRRVKAVEYQEKLKRERAEAEIVEQARRKTQPMALAAPSA